MQTPRQTAAQWHTGQTSALYAFTSSGQILPGIEAEIATCYHDPNTTATDQVALARLWCQVASPIRLNNIEAGQEFWSRYMRDSNDIPLRVRRIGKLKTWKTRPGQYRLPVKYELKHCIIHLTEENVSDWCHAIK